MQSSKRLGRIQLMAATHKPRPPPGIKTMETIKTQESFQLMPLELIQEMPRLYEQDGKGDQATVHAHLFGPIGDFYLTEVNKEGTEAFGWSRLSGMPDCAELGYISITELKDLLSKYTSRPSILTIKYMVERDLYWSKCTIEDVKKRFN